MFSPEGFINWDEMVRTCFDSADELLRTKAKESGTLATMEVVDTGQTVPYSLSDTNKDIKERVKTYKEREFEQSLLACVITTKLLLVYPPALCSPSGMLMRSHDYIVLHADRLDWCYWKWPIRDTVEFRYYFELYDKDKFNPSDIWKRFCCIDHFTGVVTVKNNTMSTLDAACHVWTEQGEIEKLVNDCIKPFVGWSLVWSEEALPEKVSELLFNLGIIDEVWRDKISGNTTTKRGRPKLEKAFVEFKSMGFNKGNRSWKELALVVGDNCGEYPSPSVLRHWAKQSENPDSQE